MIPYGDPSWYQNWFTPYDITPGHLQVRAEMRAWVEAEVIPNVARWEQEGAVPREVHQKAFEAGWLPGAAGGPWPTQYAGGKEGPEGFNVWHEAIVMDELSRCASGGFVWGIAGGLSIGLPPVMMFGSQYLKDKVAADCLQGKKMICLCITEPYGGSDVANIQTTAEKTPDGKYYVVNGEKKWITNGIWADYFTVAVRTGGEGAMGISMLLIETENGGFLQIMYNFNRERWGLALITVRFARVCLEEALKYAMKRQTFGERLIDHQSIRFKISNMARRVEACQAFCDQITHQMNTKDHNDAMVTLAGHTAMLKVEATKTFEFCAREAAQIFGGASYVKNGQGAIVERMYREVRAFAIPGGSEEIMQALAGKMMSKAAKDAVLQRAAL